MNGALMNAASRIAIAAAAGLALSASSAAAADLGGNCCADLEERVAELEATTARKGNRKMSLTVSGQITRSIMYWRDHNSFAVQHNQSDIYAGLDNHNQSSRFIFSGSAKINPSLTAGFEFMTEWAGGARTSTVNQLDEDVAPTGQANVAGNGDGVLAVRTANWWLEDNRLGKLTVGRINVGGPVATIDLGGIGTAAHFAPTLNGGGFFVTNQATGAYTNLTYANMVGPVYGGNRMEGVRWDSPSIHGFLLQATWGEDNQWSASIRYAGDWHGFRVAAGIGYESIRETPGFSPATTNATLANVTDDTKLMAGSIAVMHVATGLFVQGYYGKSDFEAVNTNTASAAAQFLDGKGKDASIWQVQAGISRNWFGIGNTSFFGEYARARDYAVGFDPQAGVAASNIFDSVASVSSSDVKIYGAGVVQQLDGAAMELYLNWRRFSPDVVGTVENTTNPGNQTAGGALFNAQPIDMITAGARIRF